MGPIQFTDVRFTDVPRLNGIEIHLEVRGQPETPRTLFLNGSGATLARTGPLLDMFAGSLHVACHDQRGLGRTEAPPGPYAMADYAADALAVADHLGWSTFRLAGVSFGGMVAQEVAVTAPDRIERLALMCTSPGGAGGSSYPLHELVDMDPAERSTLYRSLLDTRFSDEWLETHPSDRALFATMTAASTVEKSKDTLRGEWEQLQARRHHDVWHRLDHITCPTLVTAGRYDGIAPVENSVAITSRIPEATLEIYEGGHVFFLQDSRAIPDMCEFLSQ
jgi:3-oxoadipate enol-lactonase